MTSLIPRIADRGDGSSKAEGHGQQPGPAVWPALERRCCCQAAPRRCTGAKMLEETGVFDEAFFLYCEDTDLGLRARWAGWKACTAGRCSRAPVFSFSGSRIRSEGRTTWRGTGWP